MNKFVLLAFLLVLIMVASSEDLSPANPSDEISGGKDSSSSEGSSSGDDDDDSSESMEDKERMLCNVIVRATHDLHVYQSKSADEIIDYLSADCKNLENEELVQQCDEIVSQRGAKIHEHVVNGMEMSTICKNIEEHNDIDLDDEGTAQCTQGNKGKCECCKKHVEKRKMRLRFIVMRMAKKRMVMCKRSPRPQQCRQWIRRRTRMALKRINKICPYMVCKHLGFCDGTPKDSVSSPSSIMQPKLAIMLGISPLSFGLLDQQLETYLTQNVCNEFEEFQSLCVQLAAAIDSRRYAKLYMAILDNDTKWIDDELRKQVQSAQAGTTANLCDTCKNVVQSSKDFLLQAVGSIHTTLDSVCEQCPAKDKCKAFFKDRFDMITNYLNQLKPDAFCSKAGLCPSSSLAVVSLNNGDENCAICVQHLQPRKDAAIQAVKRLSVYFTDRCTEWDMPDCQQFFSEVLTEFSSFINDFDVQSTCQTMGFCGMNAAQDVDNYESAVVDTLTKDICTTLGPFEALCQQVVQGNSKQIETVTINAMSMDDLLLPCDGESTDTAPPDSCSKDKDKCKCCIAHVIRKKMCLKKRVAMYVKHMLEKCKRCPAREKCVHYWVEKKAIWDSKIDKICPMKVCTRMGYCKKTETSSVCDYMGPFKQICEQTKHNVGQLLAEGKGKQATVNNP